MQRSGNLARIAAVVTFGVFGLMSGVADGAEAYPASGPAASAAEAIYRNDLGRSGVFTTTVPATAPTERLRIPLQLDMSRYNAEDASNSPVVADGLLFVSDAKRFHAFDPVTGEERWGYDQNPAFSSPAVANGLVVVGTRAEGLVAFDAESGAEQWRFKPGGTAILGMPANTIDCSPAIVEGVVYVCEGPQGGLYALDLMTGEVTWSFDTRGATAVPVVVAGDLVIISADGSFKNDLTMQEPSTIYAVDRTSGTERWRVELAEGELCLSGPVAVDGVVYAGVSNGALNAGHVLAVDLATGHERWRSAVDAPMFAGAIAVGGGLVIVPGGQAGTVAALDAATGKERWAFAGPAPVFGSPVIAGDAVIYYDNDRVIRALDLISGVLRWEVDTGGSLGSVVLGSPWIADGTIYARAKGALVVLA